MFRQVVDNQSIYKDYIFGKQTLKQLFDKYKISISTVHRKLSSVGSMGIISSSKEVVVLIYWGRNFGIVVMKDFRTKKVIWRIYIFLEWQNWLLENGFKIAGIVCDGLRGMFHLFSPYPVQMCQFHLENTKLKEHYIEKKTGKNRYVHPRLRSAYLNIKHNMPHLWI